MGKDEREIKLERYLHNFDRYNREIMKINEEIEETEYQIDCEYSKIPQVNLEDIKVQGGDHEGPVHMAVERIERLKRKIERYKHHISKHYSEFNEVKAAVDSLNGPDLYIIDKKYFEGLKGKALYGAAGDSKRRFFYARRRILDELLSKIDLF